MLVSTYFAKWQAIVIVNACNYIDERGEKP